MAILVRYLFPFWHLMALREVILLSGLEMENFCSAAFLFMVPDGKHSSPEIPPDVSVTHFPYSSECVWKRELYILHLDINATHFPHFLNTFLGYLIVEKNTVQFFCPTHCMMWVVRRDICCCKINSTEFTAPEEPEEEQAETLGHHGVWGDLTLTLELLPIRSNGELPELRFAWEHPVDSSHRVWPKLPG